MKKILEVLQYGETDIRFNTDIDVEKNPEELQPLVIALIMTMATKLWGGNELSVLAVIRGLILADLSLSVNRKEMIKLMDEESGKLAKALADTFSEMRKKGMTVHTFGPGVKPPKIKS